MVFEAINNMSAIASRTQNLYRISVIIIERNCLYETTIWKPFPHPVVPRRYVNIGTKSSISSKPEYLLHVDGFLRIICYKQFKGIILGFSWMKGGPVCPWNIPYSYRDLCLSIRPYLSENDVKLSFIHPSIRLSILGSPSQAVSLKFLYHYDKKYQQYYQ